MSVRYYEFRWDEGRGDAFDEWGASTWYFEVDEAQVRRQIEVYDHGPTLRYGPDRSEDEYGFLTTEAFRPDDYPGREPSPAEFEHLWSAVPATA